MHDFVLRAAQEEGDSCAVNPADESGRQEMLVWIIQYMLKVMQLGCFKYINPISGNKLRSLHHSEGVHILRNR